MSAEKAIAAALEPLLDDVLALERYVAALQLKPGPPGAPGRDCDPHQVAAALAEDHVFSARIKGRDGLNGAGINSPAFAPGTVYREGVVVIAYLGQHYVALRDTAGVPGESADWARIGSWGFRHRGQYNKETHYIDGDLFIKDWGTFCVVNGAPVMLAGRGAPGKAGDPGPRGIGAPGKDGRDGSTIIGAQVEGFKLVLVAQDASGAIDHIEADFAPAYRELARETVGTALPEIESALASLRDEIDQLKRAIGRRAA